jgi:polyisoprenoid-binding protein YceI
MRAVNRIPGAAAAVPFGTAAHRLTISRAAWYPGSMPRRARLLAYLSLVALFVAPSIAPSRAGAEARQWAPVAGKSSVEFRAGFPLGDFTGRGEEMTGQFRADLGNLRQGVMGTLRVPVGSLRTGSSGRDKDMRNALEADRHPNIQFVSDGVEASFGSVTDKADVLLTIHGRLTIRGTERPVTFLGRVRLRDDRPWVRGDATLKLSDFGISRPRRLLLSVRNEVTVSFDLVLAPAE